MNLKPIANIPHGRPEIVAKLEDVNRAITRANVAWQKAIGSEGDLLNNPINSNGKLRLKEAAAVRRSRADAIETMQEALDRKLKFLPVCEQEVALISGEIKNQIDQKRKDIFNKLEAAGIRDGAIFAQAQNSDKDLQLLMGNLVSNDFRRQMYAVTEEDNLLKDKIQFEAKALLARELGGVV